MDLDGDGILDVLSGSWPGELYFFKGLGKGKYAAAETLKGGDGKVINSGSASTVFACDWRGTGKLDLLVGCIEGHVWLIPNDGTREKASYGKPVKLQAAGKDIVVTHGDSHPVMADWEGKGLPGLIVGCGDGSVQWYRNTGTRKEPKLAAAVTLVPAAPTMDWQNPKVEKEAPRGTRAKVCVVDWNGDGKLDLLVGDFAMTFGEEPKLTEADRKAKKEAEEEIQKSQKALQPYFEEANKLFQGIKPNDKEARAAANKKVEELLKKYQKEFDQQRKAYEVLRKYQRPYHYHGHVWLYLRQDETTSSRRNSSSR